MIRLAMSPSQTSPDLTKTADDQIWVEDVLGNMRWKGSPSFPFFAPDSQQQRERRER